ncbi:AMP-binding protein [Ruminococcus sp.]|uniref:AMP-binding protein n=1 Tax=Ruminococcus sp. TaxID=41978 RepID=UPI0025F9A3BA|nr:AMP-binding protein [Ruminococcus sp.]
MHKKRLCDIDLLSDEQKADLDKFNETEDEFDDTKTVVDLFREQAKKTPDNIAVDYKEKSFTYAQVDEISDRIAGFVHSKGIGKENVVFVLIPRCEYMVIASLGVLKAGAA